jgi:hypothetical protein
MTGKFLGKIKSIEFGKIKDFPCFVGIQLTFSMECGCCGCGGKYTFNINKIANYEEGEREKAITEIIDKINEILVAAKVDYISELKGKPVEVTLEENTFKDFRILTEVI